MRTFEPLEPRRLMAGQLNTSFGVGGAVTLPPLPGTEAGHVLNFAEGPDGFAYVVGTYPIPNTFDAVTAVRRVTVEGSINTSYGTGGFVDLQSSGASSPVSVQVDAHGRLYVLRGAFGPTLVRLTRDGQHDPRWGTAGVAHITDSVKSQDMVLLDDGGVVIVGYYDFITATDTTDSVAAVMRLRNNGRRDASLKDNPAQIAGLRTIDFVPAGVGSDLTRATEFSRIEKARNKTLVVVGDWLAEASDPNDPFNAFISAGPGVFRFDASGTSTLDSNVFQESGSPGDSSTQIMGMALDRQGRVYFNNLAKNRVQRMSSDLQSDPSFTINIASNEVNDLEVQSDGRVIVAVSHLKGTTGNGPTLGGFRRFRPTGAVDKSFGNNGWVYTPSSKPVRHVELTAVGFILAHDVDQLLRYTSTG